MCCTQMEELVPGHCLIVPLQHHLSTLEMENDDWDEVRVSGSASLNKRNKEAHLLSAEFHEVLDADARQREQGRLVLRDDFELQTAETHLYRGCTNTIHPVSRLSCVFQSELSSQLNSWTPVASASDAVLYACDEILTYHSRNPSSHQRANGHSTRSSSTFPLVPAVSGGCSCRIYRTSWSSGTTKVKRDMVTS